MSEPVMQACSGCGKPLDALAPRGAKASSGFPHPEQACITGSDIIRRSLSFLRTDASRLQNFVTVLAYICRGPLSRQAVSVVTAAHRAAPDRGSMTRSSVPNPTVIGRVHAS